MNRAEALKVLRLDREGDGKAVEQSYWSLVRRAQSRGEDPRARREIERLNEAYALLGPTAEPQSATTRRKAPAAPVEDAAGRMTGPVPPGPGFFFPDEFLAWFGHEAARVRARWRNRNPEIALVCGAGLVLTVLALEAGAALAPVLICAAVIIAAVWSPWRSTRSSADDGNSQSRSAKR